MKIKEIRVKPERKTADVWDAVTETTIEGSKDAELHLKTYILNEKNNSVGKTETDFTVSAGKVVLVLQSVLTYSPVLGDGVYRMVCELSEGGTPADKKEVSFGF